MDENEVEDVGNTIMMMGMDSIALLLEYFQSEMKTIPVWIEIFHPKKKTWIILWNL